MKKTIIFVLLALSFSFSFLLANASVVMLNPQVESHLNGEIKPLALKDLVPLKAVLKSKENGRAQLMLDDSSLISIAPNSEISLMDYSDDEGDENVIINIATGTARFVTGEIVRKNPDAFEVQTPNATIGIRGTMVTIVVSSDTTKVYLTETSGLGVSVTNRSTGEQKKMIKPGMLIEVTPRGMEERPGSLDEVRKMTVDLHTAPRIADDERRVPVGGA